MASPVEQIKQRLSVADVVGSYIKLQKAGTNFKAVCPFHSEKSPSFYVSPPREIWHCFGCSRGGDMFEFVKQIEGVEFPEALRILAERAGVEIREYTGDSRFKNERTRLLDLLKEAAEFYEKNLSSSAEVSGYLKKRGLSDETAKNFHLGYSFAEEKGWRNLCNFLKSKGFTPAETEKAGLAVKSDAGDYYDRFRGRIMFPLSDSAGRVVGFSGRIFGEEKEGAGKYINTPQTILYDKSKLLYAFDKAKIEIRKQDSCILMEGQMDVILAHQAGILNAVAVSGTALTAFHLEVIQRLTSGLVMCFDADEAGIEAARRSIDLALEKEFEVRAIALPAGKDPADIILEDREKFGKLASESKHIFEFFLDIFHEKHGETREFKQKVSAAILPYLLMIQSSVERSHWVQEISRRLGVKEGAVLEDIEKIYEKTKKSQLRENREDSAFAGRKQEKRSRILAERLAGISLWKNDKKIIPADVRKEVNEILEKKEKNFLNRLVFEAELCYANAEKFEDEIAYLTKELKRELIKEKLSFLADEIRICEQKRSAGAGAGDKEFLNQKLNDFQKLSKELSET